MCEGEEMQTNPKFLTLPEAAQETGFSHWTLRKFLHDGKLTRYRLGSRVLLDRSEVMSLLRPQKIEPEVTR